MKVKDFSKSTWVRVGVGGVNKKAKVAEFEVMSRLQYW